MARPLAEAEPVVAPDAPAPSTELAPGPSPEELAASERATAVLDDALVAGVWTEADRLALARESIDPDSRSEIMTRLVVALNRGELRAEASPF